MLNVKCYLCHFSEVQKFSKIRRLFLKNKNLEKQQGPGSAQENKPQFSILVQTDTDYNIPQRVPISAETSTYIFFFFFAWSQKYKI